MPDATLSNPFAKDPAAIQAVERLRRVCPEADPLTRLPDVHPCKIPRHVAIIMDGNGRWAQERGFPRIFGHRNGAAAVRAVLEECRRLGIEALTLYSFSLENWKRPPQEVEALMLLYETYLESEYEELMRNNLRFRQIGRTEGLPERLRDAVAKLTESTSGNTGPTLCLAVNYGARAEITDAIRDIAAKAAAGQIRPEDIDESVVAAHLDTAGLPEPDLLIRTAGEMRISNFLLWQISYAELVVSDVLWPDFTAGHLHAAIREFASRNRRFGGL